jgi:hypothetical protein
MLFNVKDVTMRLFLLIVLTALTGCGSNEQSTTIAGTTYTSNDKDGTATIESAKGTISVAEGASAANTQLPGYAPRFPGSTIKSTMTTDKPGSKSTTVTMVTVEPTKAVAEFYKAEFAKNKLDVKSTFSTDEAAMISAEGDGKKVSVIVSREGQETTALLSYSTS